MVSVAKCAYLKQPGQTCGIWGTLAGQAKTATPVPTPSGSQRVTDLCRAPDDAEDGGRVHHEDVLDGLRVVPGVDLADLLREGSSISRLFILSSDCIFSMPMCC